MVHSSAATAFPAALAERLRELERETGDSRLAELAEAAAGFSFPAERRTVERFRDRLSTCLMDVFRATGSPQAFGLLYELNYRVFLAVITARLRKFYFPLDPQDVLQEVFFNIYRYPHKFHADKDEAFRHWAGMIIRNTVYRATREKDRESSHEVQDEEIDARPDRIERSPLSLAIRGESAELCSKAYEIYLRLYLAAYQQLSSREKRALHLVEVEGRSYRETATELGIKLENLKMVVFRARKKILRTLDRILAQAEAWGRERNAGAREAGRVAQPIEGRQR